MKLPFRDTTLNQIVVGFAMVKLSIILLTIAAYYYFPFFCDLCFSGNFVNPADATITLATAFQTWDAQHYIYLSENWYSAAHISNAFYPLYPALIAALNVISPWPALVNALLISTVSSFIAIIFLYKLVVVMCNKRVAVTSCLLFMSFPTALYLHFAYTEAVFLALTLCSFYILYTHRSRFAVVISALLLPVTRPQGIFTVIAFIYKIFTDSKLSRKQRWQYTILVLCAAGTGLAMYFIIMKTATGFYDAGAYAQHFFESINSIDYLIHPWVWLQDNFITPQWTFNTINESVLNRVFFLGFLGSIWLVYRYTDRTLFIYTLVLGGVTAISGNLVSFPRYMLMLFPICIALAQVLQRRIVLFTAIIGFSVIQIYFILLHTRNYWIA